MIDKELISAILDASQVMYHSNAPFKDNCYQFFTKLWRFMIANPQRLRCYIRYYDSTYFIKFSEAEHLKMFESVTAVCAPAFVPEARVDFYLYHIFDVMLATATRVLNGVIPNNENTEKYLFSVIYAAVEDRLIHK